MYGAVPDILPGFRPAGKEILPALSNARSMSRHEMSLSCPPGIRQSQISQSRVEISDLLQSGWALIVSFIWTMISSVIVGL
jgi:hypothetical protein